MNGDVVVAVDRGRRDDVRHRQAGADYQHRLAGPAGRRGGPRILGVARGAHQALQVRGRGRSGISQRQHDIVARDSAPIGRVKMNRTALRVCFDLDDVGSHTLQQHPGARGELGREQRRFEILSVQGPGEKIVGGRVRHAAFREREKLEWLCGICRHAARGHIQQVLVLAVRVSDSASDAPGPLDEDNPGRAPVGTAEEVGSHRGAAEAASDDHDRAS